MEECGVYVNVPTNYLLVVAVSVMAVASVVMSMVVPVVVMEVLVIVAMVVLMAVSVSGVGFGVKEVLLQGWIIDLLLGFGLSSVTVAVIVSTASTLTISVVVLTSKVIVTLTRVQNLHLN